jgi:tetratricopeptide (TPR) repeat protein
MLVTGLVLSSWFMLSISITELNSYKGLTVSNPKQALIEYALLANLHQNNNTKRMAMLHYHALSAAYRSRDWSVFQEILEKIFSVKSNTYSDEQRVQILSKIGVAYRKNGQFKQAKKHYQCAFEFVKSDVELAQLKVNQAIVFRLSKQPALAFQLLESIDADNLPARIKAGYFVVRGNIKQSIDNFEEALEIFKQAHQLYVNVNNKGAEVGITSSILTVALAAKKLEVYEQYREGFDSEIIEYYPKLQDYLTWLDIVAYSYKTQKLSALNRQWLEEHVVRFVELGFGDSIYAHLQNLDASELYPLDKIERFSEFKLPEQLGKSWCGRL